METRIYRWPYPSSDKEWGIRLRRENQPSHSARALRARGEMLTKTISGEPSNRLANLMEMM